MTLREKDFNTNVQKPEDVGNSDFLLFPQYFLPYKELFNHLGNL